MANKYNLPYLLLRPKEPVFLVKGEGDGVVFNVPSNLLTDRYTDIGMVTGTMSDESDQIQVNGKIKLPNISEIKLKREANFSLWIPMHQKYANQLTEIFMNAKSIDELQSLAVYIRDRVNPYLFNYALSVALLHRPDTKRTSLPLMHEVFPGKFLDSRTFVKLREETTVSPPETRIPVVIPREYTSNNKEPEHALWYFREDVGINLHHWHWHLIYPNTGVRSIVNKDRRGELFYYMHQQVIARYNIERFCNKLTRVRPFSNFREVIPEGYFSKLDSQIASRGWPSRMSGTQIKDLSREQDGLQIPISVIENWRDAVVQAIRAGSVVDTAGKSIALTEEKGIDILGNIIESSVLSPNQRTYGSLHNVGHVFVSYIHDPDGRHLESFAVMGDSATALRDPIFYRWHAFIDSLFQMHKEALTPYTAQQLTFSGVEVTSIQVQIDKGKPNILQTFWQQSDVNLENGLDFSPRGNAFVRFTHLMHDPFTYTIMVNNTSEANRIGMLRIFMAPKFNENGQRLAFNEQRKLMIELDRFISSLASGQNMIRRKSTESNVTIPYDRTFRTARPQPGTVDARSFDWCGCGWPYHLLIPRGTTQGYLVELFVMVSNYDEDRVDQDMGSNCSDSFSYCGIQDRKYPDKKAMGYPFDRLPRDNVKALADFLTPNMKTQDVTITLNDKRVETKVKAEYLN